MKIDVIAFDADDTLWHNEWLYQETKMKLQSLLAPEYAPQQVADKIDEIEIGNLGYYGYGIKSFVLSLIETALELTGGHISSDKLLQIVSYGKQMLKSDVPLFEHVHETLGTLAGSFDLMLITKGENFEQQRKIRRSELAAYFKYIEVVGEKSSQTYLEILRKFGITPGKFLMVGNSLRSDILPVLEIGAAAVLIPYEMTWFHENEIGNENIQRDYYEIENLSQLPDLVSQLNSGN
jgi:putative hydrolase of the HAD superfamily